MGGSNRQYCSTIFRSGTRFCHWFRLFSNDHLVIFSGLGDVESVKKQITIGIGALSGSTILLITIPWAFSIIAGRVSLNEKGEGNYLRPLGMKKEV